LENLKFYLNRKENYEMNGILWNIKEVMWHVLKMQYISFIPKYINRFSKGFFPTCALIGEHTGL